MMILVKDSLWPVFEGVKSTSLKKPVSWKIRHVQG